MPHARNLRKGRFSIPGAVYVVTTATFHRQPFFLDCRRARSAVRSLAYCDLRGYTRTLAFVVMPDHVHWMFQLLEALPLSGTVKVFKNRSGYGIRSETGRAWQRGYYDHRVRDDEDLRAMARYLIANPLRAGLVKSIEDYAWWDAVWVESPDFSL